MPALSPPTPAEQPPLQPHELIELLRDLLDRPVGFHRVLAAIGGSATAGLFLSQAFYWSRRTADREGWFWKTQQEWQDETALTRREQETARAKLRAAGVLEEKHAGVPAKLYFRIDMARLMALLRGVASKDGGKRHPGSEAPDQDGGNRHTGKAESATPAGRKATGWAGGNRQPLIGAETTTETTQRLQQQQPVSIPTDEGAEPGNDGVVVHPHQLVRLLTERGITAGVARHLVTQHAPAAVARQVAHYDHEHVVDPADPRLTPGRLRRRIEGDWAPPPGFVPTNERARRSAEEERHRADAHAARAIEDERRQREQAATLAAVGATAEEQAAWHVLLTSPTPLPPLFRTALFRAPHAEAAPVIILRTAEERARAGGGTYAKERHELERRLRARYPAHARAARADGEGARYATYEECAAEIADRAGSDSGAVDNK